MQWLSLGLGFVQQNTGAMAWFGVCTAEHQCNGLVWVLGSYIRTRVQWLSLGLGLYSRTPV